LSTLGFIMEQYPDSEFMKADGFDDCVLGVCESAGSEMILAYDEIKVIQKLVSDGMTDTEAWEYYFHNIVCAYMGPLTPCFITIYAGAESEEDQEEEEEELQQQERSPDTEE